MAGAGTVAIIMYFCIIFVIYTAGAGVSELKGMSNSTVDISDIDVVGEHNTSFDNYVNLTFEQSSADASQDIVNLFLVGAAGLGVLAVSFFVSGASAFAIRAAVAAGLVTYILLPAPLLASLGLPYPLDWLLIGFMNLLLVIATVSFIGGYDW